MPKELMSLGEIRLRLGVSRQRAYQLSKRQDWPAVYENLSIGRVWRTEDIEAWIDRNRPALSVGKGSEARGVKRPKGPPRQDAAD